MDTISRIAAATVFALGTFAAAEAEVKTRTVTYHDGGTTLQGYLAWDESVTGKRPAVMVVHEWWGLNDYVKRRARMLAELGYAAFAVDMYGDAKVTEHGEEASAWSKQITENIAGWRQRALTGLQALREQPMVDPQRLAAVGYCFGGATVMELAYTGADLKAVVSFHGSLPIPSEEEARQIRASVLAAHGAADAFVPQARVARFQQALEQAGADWHMVIYGGARHAFTNPNADSHGIENLRYNRKADERSWRHMRQFLEEAFGS
jgi:dienelactone hydrolase